MGVYYPDYPTNSTSMQGFFEYITVVTDGLFFPMILLVVWVVIFLATKQYESSRAFTAASFIVTIMSIPLALIGFAAPYIMYMCIALTAAGVLWLRLSRD